jgi:hypothetical protein
MSFTSQNLVYVYYQPSSAKHLIGRLLLKNRQIFFEYDADFLKMGLELSPFKLPLKTGVNLSHDRVFEGLFGIFNDSLPDGWGRLLLDRKWMSAGLNPGSLSPLDRLCLVGKNSMGALTYEPENPSSVADLPMDLDEIDREIQVTLNENNTYVYESIMKATLYLTKDVRQCEVQFRNAVFNVLCHNRDDHSKNFSFLMDSAGTWTVSPAYDLTFSSGPAGEHSSMVMGEGKSPTQNHLLKLANIGNIKKEKALEMIHQVLKATQKWHECADKAGVSRVQTQNIAKFLARVHKNNLMKD